jgi:diguanylate cyclase (GGDEF)-like protein
MSNTTQFEELKVSGKLPSPSGVALELMRLMEKGDATVEELTKLVQMDPALTGRLIQFANSAFAGASRPVASAIDAVKLLGMNTVRQFALSLSLVGAYRGGTRGGFDFEGFWVASLARALAAQAISARYRSVAPQEAFTCALLSEIGRLALASVYPTEYAQCLADAQSNDESRLLELERERFSIDHCALALGLLKEWGFPAVFIDAVALHYREEGPDRNGAASRMELFARQLRLSARLGQFRACDIDRRDILLKQIVPLAQGLGLDAAEMEEIWSEMTRQWHGWSPLFNLTAPDAPPFALSPTPDEPQAEAAPPQPSGIKILLIGGDAKRASAWAKKLNQEGDATLVAADGAEGVKLAIREKPAMIVHDCAKAAADGVRFCKTLRSLEFGRSIYFMILTEEKSEEMLVQAFDAGTDDFIVTPIPERVLNARIQGGKRIVKLQEAVAHEQEEIRRYVSELAIANRRLELMAMTDSLTHLPNRRYAFSRLDEEWAAWLRTGRPLAVMVLDLDHFKSVNDTLGHVMGDRVLVHAAKTFRAALRTNDVVCRLGGEEFIVIAANTDASAARILSERLRLALEKRQIESARLPHPLTVSLGVAIAGSHTANSIDLLHRADQALYRAKGDGRNRVHIHGAGPA